MVDIELIMDRLRRKIRIAEDRILQDERDGEYQSGYIYGLRIAMDIIEHQEGDEDVD